MKKPLRIWSADRSKRYGVVAENLENLKEKASVKFGIAHNNENKIVLEEDGTLVDDSYWDTLQDHTRLILLEPNEIWQPSTSWPPERRPENIDFVDGLSDEKILAEKLFLELQQNPAIMVFLNLSDMELIKDTDVDDIDSKVVNKDVAKMIQEKCIDLYIRKKREDEALEIIDLIKEKELNRAK